MEPSFGHWFAGFFAGEGCLTITRRVDSKTDNPTFQCAAILHMRADDLPVLQEIRDQLAVGTIVPACKSGKNPSSRWAVQDKSGCRTVVETLEAYPLRAKKAEDFGVWAKPSVPGTSATRPGCTTVGQSFADSEVIAVLDFQSKTCYCHLSHDAITSLLAEPYVSTARLGPCSWSHLLLALLPLPSVPNRSG